ncbi:MAG: hypothetical protein L0228_03175 [Planctomycetes bacterium]|nr:hypothetical protein [Planctomycetota bacterium]
MSSRRTAPRRIHHRPHRRGVVLIVVIVTISISLTLFGLWARNIVKEHQRFAYQQFRLQAVRLAEAGVRRAIARRVADPQFEQEAWAVSADHLGGKHAAKVQIRAVPNDASAVGYEATAEYPADAVRQARVTRQIEMSIPRSGSEL